MSTDQLAITEKYESFINYIYPIAQGLPRRHGVAREKFLQAVFEQVNLLTTAGKSNQISRLYAVELCQREAGMQFCWLSDLARSQITPPPKCRYSSPSLEARARSGAPQTVYRGMDWTLPLGQFPQPVV